MIRTINEAGIELIIKTHKFMPRAVKIGKLYTIGYGHTTSLPDMIVTVDKAVEFLRMDMISHAATVERAVKVVLNDNQFAALTVFSAHVSDEVFKETKMLALLNRGWYDQVPAAMIKWSAKGMVNSKIRRAGEAALWRKVDTDIEQEERAA